MKYKNKDGETYEISYLSKNLARLIVVLLIVLIAIFLVMSVFAFSIYTYLDKIDIFSQLVRCVCG
jgi:hypothetical protein